MKLQLKNMNILQALERLFRELNFIGFDVDAGGSCRIHMHMRFHETGSNGDIPIVFDDLATVCSNLPALQR